MRITSIKFAVKELQCRLETWRKSREIAKAYGEKRFWTFRRLAVFAGILLLLGCGVLGGGFVSSRYGGEIVQTVKKFGQKATLRAVSQWLERSSLINAIRKIPEKAFQKPAQASVPGVGSVAGKIVSDAPARDPVPAAAIPLDSAPASLQAAATTTAERKAAPGFSGKVSPAMNYCILANKADRTLYLLGKSGPGETWRSVERFSILVGRNDGQKMTAGDQRTPEGTYFIVGRKESEELDAIYGPLAYMLNYPNDEDRKAGRTGQGIWIHGTREDTTREATRGCVVLQNNDIITLAGHLQLGIGTPVIIINTNGLSAPEKALDFTALAALRERILNEYGSRRAEFENLLSQWKVAWESRNIENYSRFYDSDRFYGEGMRWDAWREKKQRTFETYTTINIGIDKLRVSEFSETTAVILFLQRYESNTLKVQKPKRLSVLKSEGGWKIYREETFSRQELLL